MYGGWIFCKFLHHLVSILQAPASYRPVILPPQLMRFKGGQLQYRTLTSIFQLAPCLASAALQPGHQSYMRIQIFLFLCKAPQSPSHQAYQANLSLKVFVCRSRNGVWTDMGCCKSRTWAAKMTSDTFWKMNRKEELRFKYDRSGERRVFVYIYICIHVLFTIYIYLHTHTYIYTLIYVFRGLHENIDDGCFQWYRIPFLELK